MIRWYHFEEYLAFSVNQSLLIEDFRDLLITLISWRWMVVRETVLTPSSVIYHFTFELCHAGQCSQWWNMVPPFGVSGCSYYIYFVTDWAEATNLCRLIFGINLQRVYLCDLSFHISPWFACIVVLIKNSVSFADFWWFCQTWSIWHCDLQGTNFSSLPCSFHDTA